MYEKLFHNDNPFWQGMGRIFDIVELNVLWLLCSLPLFTAGPAAAALYETMFALIRGEEGYLHRDFFQAFRRRFRRNAAAGAIFAAAGAFLWVDVVICRRSGGGIYAFLMAFFFVLFLCWCCTMLYALPLLALYGGSLQNVWILAFTLSIRRFPLTVLLLLLTVLACWVCHLAPIAVFAAVGVCVHTKAGLLIRVLQPWFPEAGGEEPSGEEGPDA